MTETSLPRPGRPTLSLRLGITGARSLRADRRSAIRQQLDEVFGFVRDEVQHLSLLPAVQQTYRTSGPEGPKPRLLSPLARGADRLAAQAALELGFDLYVPMPFPRAEYEQDFTGTSSDKNPHELQLSPAEDLKEFRDLLAEAAEQIELDGSQNPPSGSAAPPTQAYEAVGRFVTRHCDLMIAVWDGEHSNGRGGTAEIVRYAATAGVPVWWIHALEDRPAVWIEDIQDLRDPLPQAADLRSAREKLKTYLESAILPPKPIRRHVHGSFARIGSIFRPKVIAPLEVYFAETVGPRWLIWNAYSGLMKWAAKVNPPWTEPNRPSDPIGQFWFDLYRLANDLAGEYAARYRSSFVWTIFLTTMALLFGAGSVALASLQAHLPRWIPIAIGALELLALSLILILVTAALRFEWHEKSIEYRLLAELFRKQQTLASVGWSLPLGSIQHLAETERLTWVSWLFGAMARSAPIASPEPANNAAKRKLLQDLIGEQLSYHISREEMARNALETFEWFGTLAFFVVLACVLLKIALEVLCDREKLVLLFGLLATVLPGISAAFVALRSYAELRLLAEQSRHMNSEMKRFHLRVARLRTERTLVSQDLGTEAAAVAAIMLQDLEGWGRLFGGKLMEAG